MTRTFALLLGASMAIGSGAMAANIGGQHGQQAGMPQEYRGDVSERMGPKQRPDELATTTQLNLAQMERAREDAAELRQHDAQVSRGGDMGAPGAAGATRSSDQFVPETTEPAGMGIHR